ncbi:MAG TPA: 30S ribosomal protein S20 [Candidatus Binatia bacterium]|nr:30S ribosomal protein S20 [Candidatus Binatia bacterium]
MASSEEKRHKQNLKRHARNQTVKSRIKTLMKKVVSAAGSGDAVAADAQLRAAASAIQKAGRKRILHPNTAARRVARLARTVHRSKSAASPAQS